ncbi:MAG TPA: hypothetical protein VG457_07040 [Planctomycetota bacterium]|jgi:hypothetical protein|nr:hypothetical protein [Planctomycetota bacterium]
MAHAFFNPNAGPTFFTPRFQGGGNFVVQNNNFFNVRMTHQFNACQVGGFWRCPPEFRHECFERSFRPGWQFVLGATLGGALNAYANYQAAQNGAYYPPAVFPQPYAYAPSAPPAYPTAPAQAGLPGDAENKYEAYRGYAAQRGNFAVVQALDQLAQDPNFRAIPDPAAQDEAMRYLVDNPWMTARWQGAIANAAASGRLPVLAQALRDPGYQQQLRTQGPEFAVAMLQGPPPGMPPQGTPPPTTPA